MIQVSEPTWTEKDTSKLSAIPYARFVFSYAKEAPDFLHETGTDTSLSPAQFESYRKLGEHSMDQVLADAQPHNVRELLMQADRYIEEHHSNASTVGHT